MAIMLMSLLNAYRHDQTNKRVPTALNNDFGVLDNVTALLPRAGKLVTVANDPRTFEDNDDALAAFRAGFELSGIRFGSAVALDDRNKTSAEDIIKDADLIILCGGKCPKQMRFFNEIGLKKLLENHKGLIIGISAGAMNLCGTVANFPEETSDLSEPRWLDGMGFFDGIVIPHFDGDAMRYQFDCGEVSILDEYILPMSMGREFIGLTNDSYIVISGDGGISYHGKVYKISDGRITRF